MYDLIITTKVTQNETKNNIQEGCKIMITMKLFDNKLIVSNYAAAKQGIKQKKDSLKNRDYSNESLSRTKRKIYEFGICNNWTHFLTMTFNSKKIDRHNLKDVKSKFIKYLKNYSRIDKDFKYLVIPELHKNGAIHFHGLVCFGSETSKYLKRFKNNIFNHKLFTERFGFNRFIAICEKSVKVISYIVKYVSKDVGRIFRNYYFHSNNLVEPFKIKIEDFFENEKILKKIETLNFCEHQGFYSFSNVFVNTYVIEDTHVLYKYYYTKFFEKLQVER